MNCVFCGYSVQRVWNLHRGTAVRPCHRRRATKAGGSGSCKQCCGRRQGELRRPLSVVTDREHRLEGHQNSLGPDACAGVADNTLIATTASASAARATGTMRYRDSVLNFTS